MGLFTKRLEERNPDPTGRRWLFVPYDQLSDRMGPLAREDPRSLGIVLVETTWKGNRRPYHKQKLALILANLRHFALEQADRGVAVKHVVAESPYHTVLLKLAKELGPMRVMTPAERELREDLKGLMALGALNVIPHEGWLTTSEQFRSSAKKGPAWRMDRFYRRVRQHTGILMKKGKPVDGKFSFDSENLWYNPTLRCSQIYYWQVVASNSYGSTFSPIWSFTTESLEGDFDLNCIVDSYDLRILADYWLHSDEAADMVSDYGDNLVDFLDFAVFSENWLYELAE